MKYLLLLNRVDDELPEAGTPERDAIWAAYGEVIEEMASAGVLIECAPLGPHSAATTVRVRNGETVLTDGPAAELKEHIGGYTLIDVDHLDDAIKWAEKIPASWHASIEVRAVVDTGRAP